MLHTFKAVLNGSTLYILKQYVFLLIPSVIYNGNYVLTFIKINYN